MKLVPRFDKTRIIGIQFVPELDGEWAMIEAFIANGNERQNGDITVQCTATATGKSSYGMAITLQTKPA